MGVVVSVCTGAVVSVCTGVVVREGQEGGRRNIQWQELAEKGCTSSFCGIHTHTFLVGGSKGMAVLVHPGHDGLHSIYEK